MSAAQSAKRTQPGKAYAKKTSRQSAAKRSKKAKAVKKASTRRIIIALVGIAAIIMLTIGGFMANRMLERRTYKLIYADEILACADEFSLDPCLVAAVIHTESSNRAVVVSPKGAIGLMQIMPSTGEWIAGKLGMADYSEEKLMEPLINIRLGCWYLRYLSDKYGGMERTALSAYNAGPGNVDKWLNDPAYGDGKRLISIPYVETAAYADKVLSAKEKYSELYEKELCK